MPNLSIDYEEYPLTFYVNGNQEIDFHLKVYSWMHCEEIDKIYNSWKIFHFLEKLNAVLPEELQIMKDFVVFHKFYTEKMEKRIEGLLAEERIRRMFLYGEFTVYS